MSGYHVYITPSAFKEIRKLPGHMRQRIIRAVDQLAKSPRPPKSTALKISSLLEPPGAEPRRLRIGRWRIIYVVLDEDGLIDILAVRKRPPYDYGDLAGLLSDYML